MINKDMKMQNVKAKVIYICYFFVCILVMCGCGKKDKGNEEVNVNDKSQKVCGIVRSIDDEIVRIQLCGNIFQGTKGMCYIEVKNTYETIEENDNVLMYYSSDMKFEKLANGDYVAKNIEVTNIERYDNDCEFKARIYVSGNLVDENGEEYSADDPRGGCVYFVEALQDEAELNFEVLYTGKDVLNVDIQKEVSVVYDVDSMSVISITQE